MGQTINFFINDDTNFQVARCFYPTLKFAPPGGIEPTDSALTVQPMYQHIISGMEIRFSMNKKEIISPLFGGAPENRTQLALGT